MEPPLADRAYAVLDLEFTGLSPLEGDVVLELAVVRVEGGRVAQTWAQLLDPERPVPAETLELTGIDPRDLAGAPRFADVAPTVLGLIGDRPIVSHNLAYDVAALQWELARLGLSPLPNLGIDTLELARRVYPGERNNLRDLAARLGIERRPTHRALDDARVTADAFLALVRTLAARALRDLKPVESTSFLLRPAGADPSFWDAIADVLVRAVAARRQLRIAYGTTAATAAERVVDPFCLIGPYLRAYCETRRRELNFLVARIWKAEETGTPVTRLPEPPRGPAVFSPAWHRATGEARRDPPGGAA